LTVTGEVRWMIGSIGCGVIWKFGSKILKILRLLYRLKLCTLWLKLYAKYFQ